MESDKGIKSVVEVHEEFIQHIELGSSRIRRLSVLTIIVSILLAANYLYQIMLPFIFNLHTISVPLDDPILIAFEIFLLILSMLWMYIGVSDYRFTTNLFKSIKEAREMERELERKIIG